ncbi:MAG: patatin-like phospholipase family protein [Pseudomonadota bacterium]
MSITQRQQRFIITNSTDDGAPACMPSQVVLVMQGGGALGAYQAGVYTALFEAGLEPDWIIGTSIGAINGAIIAGNPPETRLQQLTAFWDEMEHNSTAGLFGWSSMLSKMVSNFFTFTQGIPGFFSPNPLSNLGPYAKLGSENASYYRTHPLKKTLSKLVDFEYLKSSPIRLTLSAVEIQTGQLHYFDSRHIPIQLDHIMASGALPPAFPAVRIDDKIYWDGGLYSNTPIEVIFNQEQRHNSLIFSVNLWNSLGKEPQTMLDVMGREKDIQYASRLNSYLYHQKQMQLLRQIILRLVKKMPEELQEQGAIRQLEAYGCSRTMHVVQLLAPNLKNEDYTKDIDFSPEGIRTRRKAGYDDTVWALKKRPWQNAIEKFDAVLVHDVTTLRTGEKNSMCTPGADISQPKMVN